MSDDISAGIVRILSGRSVGTGFVVSDDGLLATCAHVLGSPCPEKVTVIFLATNEQREATVEEQWLRDVEAEDMAILRLEGSLPQGVKALPLGSSTGVSGHKVSTFGFPSVGEVEGVAGYGKVLGRGSQTKAGQPLLQIRSSEITRGFSGAPVWDEMRQRVIGQVVMVATPDASGKMGETAFATPTETLQRVCTDLQIPDINPYRGLNPFTEVQARYFFGRKQDVDRLVNKLRLDPSLLVVLGPSGSGKSSLVQAGLIPRLREGEVPGSDGWEILITRPADNPFKQLVALGVAVESHNLTDAIREWLKQHPKQPQMLLIFDEFEELLATGTEEITRDFLTQLTMLLEARLPVTIMIVMCDDFYSHLAQNAKLMEWLEQSQGLISVPATLGWESLAAIVQDPAKTVGLRFEEGLVEEIVEDSTEGEVSEEGERIGRSAILPLLEFALTELCERREDGVLTFKAYEKIGGVTGGLRQWADQTFNSLEDEQKKQFTSRIFTDLVYLGDERQDLPDSCRSRWLRLLYRNEGEREDIYKLVQRLVNARLLVTSYDTQSNEVTVEIIHDVLLREWGLLKWWLKKDRPFLVWHQELEEDAQAWEKSNPNETRFIDSFLKGSSLSEAEGWMELRTADLNQAEQNFIKASRAQQTKEDLRWKRQYENAEQQRQEAERLRQEAEKQRQEAERQKLEAEQQREEAIKQRQEAERQRQEVEKQRREADRQRLEAEQQREEAIKQRQEAERRRQVALARQLTAQAELMRNQQGNLVQRSVLLAVEAVQRSPSLEVDQTLRNGLTLLPRPVAYLSPKGDVNAVALSSDGRYLVTAYRGRNIEVWDVPSSRPVVRLLHKVDVKNVAFSFDSRWFATTGTDSTIRVWETSRGRQVAPHFFTGSTVQTIILSRNGRYLAAMSAEGSAWIWEVIAKRQLALMAHEGIIYAAGFSLDERYLATAGVDGAARVWDVTSGRRLANLTHERSVNAVVFSPDGRYLATTSTDRTVGVWETQSGYRLICLPHKDVGYKDENYVNVVAFSTAGHYIHTASLNGAAGMWEIINHRFTHQRSVSAVTFSADGRYFATASEDGTAGVWETTNGYRHLNLSQGSKIWAIAFSPDGSYLAVGSEDGEVCLWEMLSGRQLICVTHKGSVNAVAFSPDERYLATASSDNTAKIWETTSGRLLFDLPHNDMVNVVVYSSDGRYLATASNDGSGHVWEAASGRPLADLPHKLIVNMVAFSPDGRYLATASWDHTARVWEAASGRLLLHVLHESKVWGVAFSPDSKYLGTASKDHTASVWEIHSGTQLISLIHDDSVSAVAFSPNGKYIATASEDSTAGVWEIASGSRLAYLTHENGVTAVTFSPDGKYVATASMDGTARLRFWQPVDLIAEACTRLTRNLTQEEWQQYLGNEPYRKTCLDLKEI